MTVAAQRSDAMTMWHSKLPYCVRTFALSLHGDQSEKVKNLER